MNLYKLIFLSLFTLLGNLASSQEVKIGLSAHYMYQFPLGSIGNYYGNNSNIGANFNIKTFSNWTFGVEGQFLFGSSYKDLSLLGSAVTSGGFIIGKDQSIEQPNVEGRGGNIFLEAGRIFTLNKSNLNSGIHLKMGVGYMFYSAFVNTDPKIVLQLSGDYADGYSRLQSGPSFNGYLGYTYYGKDKLLNGSIGIQMLYSSLTYQGTTNFSNNTAIDKSAQGAFFIGPKATLTVLFRTLYRKDANSDGYYYN